MKPALSVIVPVWNAQSTIGSILGELLDLLPELTPSFELIVVDDGSTDATSELLDELAGSYPQLRLARLPTQQGVAAAIRSGLERTGGERVLICADAAAISLHEIGKLWAASELHDAVVGRLPARSRALWLPRLPGSSLNLHQTALVVLRRRVLTSWQWGIGSEDLLAWLARHGVRLHEVEVRPRPQPAAAVSTAMRAPAWHASVRPAPAPNSAVPRPKHVSYLRRLRNLALGE